MPIYEYTCGKCGAHLEVMQKISDKPLARHARCGGKLSKEWSQTSFQLKGSGWYVTDYAGKKSEAKESKETKESSTADAKKETKETKAETSSPTKDKQKPKASAAAGGD
jgi:putative FmdB family regulatory protein